MGGGWCTMLEAEEDEPLLAAEDQPSKSVRFSTRFRKETKPNGPKMASGTLVPSIAPPTQQVRWADGVHQDPGGRLTDEPAAFSAANPTPSLHQAIAAYNAGGAATLSLAGQVAACKAGSASSAPGAPSLTDAVENFMARQRKAAAAAASSDPDATQQPQTRGAVELPMLGKELAPARRSPRFERFSTVADGRHSPSGARSPRSGSPLAPSRSPIMKGGPSLGVVTTPKEGPPLGPFLPQTSQSRARRSLDNRGGAGAPRGMANCSAPPPPAGRFQRSGSRGSGARAIPALPPPVEKRAAPPVVEHPPVGDLLGDLMDMDNEVLQSMPGAGGPQSAPLFEQQPPPDRSASSTLASDLHGVRL